MEEQRFDDLARVIAQKTSRRQVLKLLAGAAVGGVFADGLSPALAAGNPGCAKFCDQVFGKGTTAAKQCVSDARAHAGLCYSACGPAGSGGTLCGSQSGGYYTSYSSTTCCTGGQCCDSSTNTCAATTCSGSGCAGCGSVSIPVYGGATTCAKPCTSNSQCTTSNSVCSPDPSGNYYCSAGDAGQTCTQNTGCGAGAYCTPAINQQVYPGVYFCSTAVC